MFIEIENLKPEPLQVQHVFPIGEIRFKHEDAVLNEPVAVDFTIAHRDRDLQVSGDLKTAIHFKCSRCAKEFDRSFSTSYDLSYLPQPKWTNKDAEVELRYDDMEIAYYNGIAFDVDLMALEQIELTMPMKFICREDCKGLCYRCGADLNEGECHCGNEETGSSLSVLLDFKKRKDK